MMGTLIHGQLYTFSYRAALLWPQKIAENKILGQKHEIFKNPKELLGLKQKYF